MRLLTLFAALLLATATEAGPRHWLATHKRFVSMEAIAIGAAIAGAGIHAYGLHHCRRLNGVEPCDEHYGAAWAMFGVSAGVTVIVMPAIAEGCWKDNWTRSCYVFAYSGSSFETWWGIHEARIHENTTP
jgi:hypothetical protein